MAEVGVICNYFVDTTLYSGILFNLRDILLCYPLPPNPLSILAYHTQSA